MAEGEVALVSYVEESRAKRVKRTLSEITKEQRQRPPATIAGLPRLARALSSEVVDSLDVVPRAQVEAVQEHFSQVEPFQVDMAEELPNHDPALQELTRASSRRKEEKLFQEQEQERLAVLRDQPVMESSNDITCDLTLRTAMRLVCPKQSWRWLKRLPPILGVPSLQGKESIKEHMAVVCKMLSEQDLPGMMNNLDNATKWLFTLANCLSWHQLEGPQLPKLPTPAAPLPATPEAKAAWKQVMRWDEAYRGLGALLTQGVAPCFSIVAERFTVTVFGEGSGPWTAATSVAGHEGDAIKRPRENSPVAVLGPALRDLRSMLMAHNVSFEAASCSAASSSKPGLKREHSHLDDAARHELQELENKGERVLRKDDDTSAYNVQLWFDGRTSVHAMLDVLRQYFLGHSLEQAPKPLARLPLLVSATPFPWASTEMAEVVKIREATSGAAGAPASAELHGLFFPTKARRLAELLRVTHHEFTMEFPQEPQHGSGVNVFTILGPRRIESVTCEKLGSDPSERSKFSWEFRLSN